MRSRRARSTVPWTIAALVLVLALALAGSLVGGTFAAFTGATASEGNVVSAASDFRPPAVTEVDVGRGDGEATGAIGPGDDYYVYAIVEEDTGDPPSGIASVTADVSALTDGSTAVTLVDGSHSVGGTAFNHRSALLTADGTLTPGPASFSVTATDGASNSETRVGSVTVEGP